MPFCRQCGSAVGDADRLCPSCGAPQDAGPAAPALPSPLLSGDARPSLRARTSFLRVMLVVSAVIAAVAVLSTAAEVNLLQELRDGQATIDQAEASDARQAGIAGIGLIAAVITIVVWCMWQHRAQSNLSRLGFTHLRFTPGWAVGWWFIPFANLVMPLRAMSELWRTSVRAAGASAKLGLWWTAFLVQGVLGGISAGLQTPPNTFDDLIPSATFSLASSAVHIVAAVLAFVLVGEIASAQESTGADPGAIREFSSEEERRHPSRDLPPEEQFRWRE